MRDEFVQRVALILVAALLFTVAMSKSNPIRAALDDLVETGRHSAVSELIHEHSPQLHASVLSPDNVQLLKCSFLGVPYRRGGVGP